MTKMPPDKPGSEFNVEQLKQMCTRAILAPAYVKCLQMTRKACTPRRYNPAAKPEARRVIADVYFTPFHFNAYVLETLAPDGAEFECVLEIARYVFFRFGGRHDCVSLYRDGPTASRNVAHIRFHDPPRGNHGIEMNVQLIMEIALFRLRGKTVRPLLASLREANDP